MTKLQLAANYIELGGVIPSWLQGSMISPDWGHLQIVFEGQEIEVQSPVDEFSNEFPYFAYPQVRSHTDPNHTTGITEGESKYRIVDLDVGERDPAAVWALLQNIHQNFFEGSPDYFYSHIQNSNSYAVTLLWMVGIDVTSTLIASVTPTLVENGFPGYTTTLVDRWTDTSGVFAFDFSGTTADDFVRLGVADDVFHGLAGDDTVFGSLGIDLIEGGDGEDTLHGGDQGDTIRGGAWTRTCAACSLQTPEPGQATSLL